MPSLPAPSCAERTSLKYAARMDARSAVAAIKYENNKGALQATRPMLWVNLFLMLLQPLLDDIFYQQGDTPLFIGCDLGEEAFCFFVGSKCNKFSLLHIHHLYTWYIFLLDETRYTRYT